LIRLATAADISSIVHLERSCASAAHWTEQQYRQLLESEDAKRLVLVADAPFHSAPDENAPGSSFDILGFLVARHLTPEWELENLVVASTARRQGLGRRLMQALLAMARETNSHSVFLEVRESNAAARSLYEKTGFAQTGRRKAYYKDPPEDALLYRFSLK
jgi:[ribosomal protein S18]-alanine N-acetyltransferase